ncbi:S8 family serine peptidase [Tenacibaculum mesophilum]|uniref:S8 family serine peptidase n=1 Tax=Tenacibaculum mesophilum TaxID=104268 RepID=UPI002492FF86|nr:S8 family serine peptidase [Tenacibaculum mesophilum]
MIKLEKHIEKKEKVQTVKEFENWHFKDIELDTLSGLSLNRAYDSLLINKKGKEVVIAVIDMAVEINHDGIKEALWYNKQETANGIDDDENGYVDDINGWNFLSNNQGDSNEFVNYEYTRLIRKFESSFEDKDIVRLSTNDSLNYIIYQKAKEKYKAREEYAKKEVMYINNVAQWKEEAEEIIFEYLKKNNYNLKELDSLKLIYPKEEKLQEAILKKSNFIKINYTNEYIEDYKLKTGERLKKLLNLNYNDRSIQGDNQEDLKDIKYGSPLFSNVNTKLLDHGTKMAGVIVNVGQKEEIKIMPLAISAYGDEHDKDIALAIRYAVDNGANVINMSFAKEFSLHPEWVLEAIKYAEQKNVLIVSGAANDGENIDGKENAWFPNDHGYFDHNEVSDNFLKIGSSGIYLDEKLKSSFSNYGKGEVDLFAPGEYIYTTTPNNEFDFIQGTSASTAITSGVAALIYSYYPNLTASQIKHILMDSGLEYTFEVSTPTKEDKNKTTPFNQLSKSGKVLNAYNALIMADSISRN